MSLIPTKLNLSNFEIKSDSSNGLKFFNKFNLPNASPNQNDILQFNSDGTAQFAQVSASGSNFNYNFYVSNASGSNTNSGNITAPFKTVSQALTASNSIADSIPVVINLSAGTYTEDITITRSNTSISGASICQPNACVVNGQITFSMIPTGQYSVGGLSNLQVNILQHNNSTVYPNSVVINNCIVVPPSGKNAIITNGTGGSILGDMTLSNSLVYMSDLTAVVISSTSISAINTQVINNPSLTPSINTMINVSGNGRINLFGSSVISQCTLGTVQPLITIANTATVVSPSTINSSILQYTSSTSDAGSLNKCCIRFSGTASMNVYYLINSFLKCDGAQTNAPNNYCIQKGGSASLTLFVGGCLGGVSSKTIPASGSGLTKTALPALL